MATTTFPDDFFAEFPPVSKEEWLQQIAKDLKNRPLEELDWKIEEGLSISPFAHADDFDRPPLPLSAASNDWEICEDVFVSEAVAANRQALEALEGGAEGLKFHFETPPGRDVFQQVFEKIHPDFIGLHFAGKGVASNPATVAAFLYGIAQDKGLRARQLRGSLTYDPVAQGGLQDWRYLVDYLHYMSEMMPDFKAITIGEATISEDPVAELSGLLQQGNFYLKKLEELGVSLDQMAAQIQFSISIGKSYFLEIAKIRAFKLLWLNVLKAWGAAPDYPFVEVRFQPEAYTDDLYSNMIRATTMAMSAVLGGARRLTVLPYDVGREAQAAYPRSFGRRIARNVQHLLKMEGFFNEIPDAAAGSYYIEQLTRRLAERAWEEFMGH